MFTLITLGKPAFERPKASSAAARVAGAHFKWLHVQQTAAPKLVPKLAATRGFGLRSPAASIAKTVSVPGQKEFGGTARAGLTAGLSAREATRVSRGAWLSARSPAGAFTPMSRGMARRARAVSAGGWPGGSAGFGALVTKLELMRSIGGRSSFASPGLSGLYETGIGQVLRAMARPRLFDLPRLPSFPRYEELRERWQQFEDLLDAMLTARQEILEGGERAYPWGPAVEHFARTWLGIGRKSRPWQRDAVINLLISSFPEEPDSLSPLTVAKDVKREYHRWHKLERPVWLGRKHGEGTLSLDGTLPEGFREAEGSDGLYMQLEDERLVAVLDRLTPEQQRVALAHAAEPRRCTWPQAARAAGFSDEFGEKVRRKVRYLVEQSLQRRAEADVTRQRLAARR